MLLDAFNATVVSLSTSQQRITKLDVDRLRDALDAAYRNHIKKSTMQDILRSVHPPANRDAVKEYYISIDRWIANHINDPIAANRIIKEITPIIAAQQKIPFAIKEIIAAEKIGDLTKVRLTKARMHT